MTRVSDFELRSFVFQEVARHLGRASDAVTQSPAPGFAVSLHAGLVSHVTLSMAPAVAAGEACVIEPAVRCNNCGYCKSLGY